MNVEIISTGGTYAELKEHGVDVLAVSEITHFPEILDGRVKTLHPKIHGALLAVLDNTEHVRQIEEHDIEPIDMVVVNLYPFEQTISRNGVPLDQVLEQIDIGGPAMIRSAAKNFRYKAVIINPDRFESVIAEMKANNGAVSEETCFALAKEVFRYTSSYDAVISGYLAGVKGQTDVFPRMLTVTLSKEYDLRYGENPHQRAALYGNFGSLFQKLHGKDLSYNNITDITAAWALVMEFEEPTIAIVKHTNPCGVGSGKNLADAYEKAIATDPTSAFGSIIAANRPLDLDCAEHMHTIFTEVIIAPDFPEPVLAVLRKKKDRRLIRSSASAKEFAHFDVRSVPGGLLMQTPDGPGGLDEEFTVVTRRKPTEDDRRSLIFAWKVAKHVKSNAIVYARSDRTVGIGAGQMSRVDSAKIAALKAKSAGLDCGGTAAASDGFFPFADGLLEVVAAGSTSVIQPGGSVRDAEVIQAADDNNIAMVFTRTRHFKH